MNTACHKSIAAKKAQAAQFAAQTIVIDDDWRIVRADRLNWEVQFKGQFHGYFGCLLSAFQALPAKMLDAEAKDSLQRIQEQARAINERIATALKFKLA
jgi:hypothetical protein